MVDPDGKEVCLSYDSEKKQCKQIYTIGMNAEQFKENASLYKFVSGLNKVSTIDIGEEVINALIASPNRYQYTDKKSPEGQYGFKANTNEFYMGNLSGAELDYGTISRIGHEAFHAYQKDQLGSKMQSGIDIEVEGYLFQSIIENGLDNYRPEPEGYIGGMNIDKGIEYSKGMISMVINYLDRKEFPIRDFRKAVDNFKEGSFTMGAYKDFPTYTYTKKQAPIIATLYHAKVKQ
mgnify:FL=1